MRVGGQVQGLAAPVGLEDLRVVRRQGREGGRVVGQSREVGILTTGADEAPR